MSELTQARDWARRMATAVHRPDCRVAEVLDADVAGGPLVEWIHPDPACGGCVTDADRVLWRRQANEYDRYLRGVRLAVVAS